MRCYIISYDLRGTRDYESLYKAIKSYPNWAHITESTWAIITERTAVQVRDDLCQVIDRDDRVFVVKSGTEAAWHNVLCKNKWLKDNL
ncbi:MAG: CRISPR-associated protein Cas2 [Gemmatimonadetes bacterium]|nr:CRISPR-associated protein Cas2 [Gemmatimonadota bacterium]MYE94720.1 CRISPR-associated protein Cas2 [Gemmatimonadota bacterium]MYJ09013.1 CRISPR-associated protein Cas2 [Gemmatimonadota bacterium]